MTNSSGAWSDEVSWAFFGQAQAGQSQVPHVERSRACTPRTNGPHQFPILRRQERSEPASMHLDRSDAPWNATAWRTSRSDVLSSLVPLCWTPSACLLLPEHGSTKSSLAARPAGSPPNVRVSSRLTHAVFSLAAQKKNLLRDPMGHKK